MKGKEIAIVAGIGLGAVGLSFMMTPKEEQDYPFSGSQFVERLQSGTSEIYERIQGGTSQVFESVKTVSQISYLPEKFADAFTGLTSGITNKLVGVKGVADVDERSLLFPLLNPQTWMGEIGTGLSSIATGLTEIGLIPYRIGEWIGFGGASGVITITKQLHDVGYGLADSVINTQKALVSSAQATPTGQVLKKLAPTRATGYIGKWGEFTTPTSPTPFKIGGVTPSPANLWGTKVPLYTPK